MKGVKPSASSGSHNSFIKPLASSLVSFSPVKMVANGDIDMSQILSTYVSIKLTQVGQQPEEIFAKHGLVWVFVVQLQDLNEIVDATGVLGVLGLFEEGIHILEDDGLLALLLLTSNLDNGLHGGVQVASADEISNVETIDLAISLEVIDLKGELDFCKDLTNDWSKYLISVN